MQPEDLLNCLQSFSTATTDNAARAAIEARMEEGWQTSAPSMMLSMQAIIANPNVPVQSRSLAAVLLRRGMGKVGANGDRKALFETVPAMEQRAVVEGLLAVLQQSQPNDLANKVADAIAEAVRLSDTLNDISQQVVNFIAHSLSSSTGGGMLTALRVLEGAPTILKSNEQHRTAGQLLSHCLQRTDANVTLIAAVMKAIASLLLTIADVDKRAYSDCIRQAVSPLLTKKLVDSITDDDEPASDFLSAVIDGVIEAPKMFKETAVEWYTFGLLVANQHGDDIDVGVRSLGIELSLCILEQLTGQFKKRPDCIQSGLNVILQMMCQVEDCQEWYEADGPDADEDIDEVAILGEQSIDRFAIALSGRFCAEPFFALTSSLLSSPQWNHQYGALKAIASTAEGMMDVLEDRLEQVLSLIWPNFTHQHPRVQYAACHALGQLCTDFDGAIQSFHTKQSLECLVGVLTRSQTVRVQQHAAAALVNFAEGVDSAQLSPFLDGILSRLVQLLNTPRSHLQQQLIATIAAFSSAAESLFTKYLESLMPILMTCCSATHDRLLQCRAVEAMSIFALAVGKEAFFQNPNGPLFMAFLKQQEQVEMSSDDQMAEYLQTAWVRMCQVLGDDFAPYLQCCLPRMIKQAQAEADVAILDADTDDHQEYDESEWDFAEINGRRYGIHTACLEEKCVALENIAAIAGTMGAAFAPFTHDCLFTLAIPLLEFDMHDGVESAAADLTSACIRSMAMVNPAQAQQAAVQCLGKLVETAKSKYSPEYTTAAIDSISAILADDRMAIADAVVAQLLERVKAIAEFAVKRVISADAEQDQDEDEDSNENADDTEVVFAVARLYATACKKYNSSCQPQLLSLLDFAMEQLDARRRRPNLLVHAGLCMLVDAVQWMPAVVAAKGYPVPAILTAALSHQDRDIRQAAVFGCGVVGESAVRQFEPFIVSVLPTLLQQLRATKTPSNAVIHDNIVSACIKMMNGFESVKAKQSEIVPVLLAAFPVTADSAEFINCYGFLNALLPTTASVTANILESVLEACFGAVSKHLPAALKASLKAHIPNMMAVLGPSANDLVSRYDLRL